MKKNLDFDDVHELLTGHRPAPWLNSVMVRCPAHNDKKESLHLTRGRNNVALIKCFAGCTLDEILAAMGLSRSDMKRADDEIYKPERWKEKTAQFLRGWNKPPIPNCNIETIRVIERYDYLSANGDYRYSKIRVEADLSDGTHDKTMLYGIMNFEMDYFKIQSLKGSERLLYNLPELMDEKRKDEPVFYTEGEKDCLSLVGHGLIAVTAGGTNDWRRTFAEFFQGRDVVILGDNDKPGKKLVESVRRDLLPVVKTLKIIYPSKIKKGDVTDFLTVEGGTIDELIKMVDEAPFEETEKLSLIEKAELKTLSDETDALILKKSGNGKIAKVLENYVEILRSDPFIKSKIRYNALCGRPELQDFPWNLSPHLIQDNDFSNLRLYLSEKYTLSKKEDLLDAINIVSYENSFHPVVDLLKSLKWDGVPRINRLFPRYLGATESEYTTVATTILLHGAIQRVFNPGVKFDIAVVLADKKQGGGKSTMCRLLALNDSWFSDSLTSLKSNKETFETLLGHWIIEIGEMLAIRSAKDIETTKSFITRQVDNYRVPFGIYANGYPRQCVFICTTNRTEFLPADPSGNRRFLPIFCDATKAEVHPLENEEETRAFILQCYAEAIEIGERDGWMMKLPYKLEATLEDMQSQAEPEDPNVGMIQSWLDDPTNKKDIVCSLMIFDHVFNKDGIRTPTRFELRDISEIMNFRIQGWKRYGSKGGRYKFTHGEDAKYGQQRCWERIPKCDKECDKECDKVTEIPKKAQDLTDLGFVPLPEDDAEALEKAFM